MKIVLSNVPPAEAELMARTLVTERLAACVNLTPVRSVYRWQGTLQEDSEVTLTIKVSSERVAELCERIRALHSYTVPEILVMDVDTDASHAGYVQWVRAECDPTRGSPAE